MSLARKRLGSTGLMVSRLALRTMTFGLQTDEATSQRILDKAVGGAGMPLATLDPALVAQLDELTDAYRNGDAPR